MGRQLFEPVRSSIELTSTLDELVSELYTDCPKAVAFTYAMPEFTPQYEPSAHVNVANVEEHTATETSLQPFSQYVKQFTSVQQYTEESPSYTEAEVKLIERTTRQQATSDTWQQHRLGGISASVVYRVHTVMAFKKAPSATAETKRHLVRDITKPKDISRVPAVKYGRENEPIAADEYYRLQQESHQLLKVELCGLFVDRKQIYLCASPDQVVSCDCCGQGLLETKCPKSCEHSSPQTTTLEYLVRDETNKLTLHHNHKYFTQVQMQMAMTGYTWCDFFVYSPVDYFLEWITFDRDFWESLRQECSDFFYAEVLISLI